MNYIILFHIKPKIAFPYKERQSSTQYDTYYFYIIPCDIMAFATFINPATLAPLT